MYEHVTTINMVAGEDLRDDLYALLKLDATGRVVKTTAATDVGVGVLAENPNDDIDTTGLGVPVTLLHAQIMFRADGAITSGDNLIPSASEAGRVTSGTAGVTVGKSLETVADNDVFDAIGMQGTIAGS